MDVRSLFLAQKESMRKRTWTVLEALQPADSDWRPEAGALSIGEMIRHLWKSEEGVRKVALKEDFSYYQQRIPLGLKKFLGSPGSLEGEMTELERVHTDTLREVQAFPVARWDERRSLEVLGYDRQVAAILFGIIEHEAHHRGQLTTYLRVMGRPLPEVVRVR